MGLLKIFRMNIDRDISGIQLIVDGTEVQMFDLNILTSFEYWYHAGIKSYVCCFKGARIDHRLSDLVERLIDKEVELRFDINNMSTETKDFFLMSGVTLWAACLGQVKPDNSIRQTLIFKCSKHQRLEALLSSGGVG